jgi:UDP-3-O-[3-hydroxymyristoyl] N-acetylglucosamine deacetylase
MFFRLRREATIGRDIEFRGIGVHSGVDTTVRIMPAGSGSGIIFRRVDILGLNQYVCPSPEMIVDSAFCTRISNADGVTVSVVEHLLASFRACGITNAIVELDTSEVPIMDGSALAFVTGFKRAGIVRQSSLVPALVIKTPVSVSNDIGKIDVFPSRKCRISVSMDYDRINRVIGNNNSHTFSPDGDLSDIIKARTFGWLDDLESIRSKGLALGASRHNTVGISSDNGIVNEGGLRHPKEIVMHKCLDLLGDISILGIDVIGKIKCVNTSHSLNRELVAKLAFGMDKHEFISGERSCDCDAVPAIAR